MNKDLGSLYDLHVPSVTLFGNNWSSVVQLPAPHVDNLKCISTLFSGTDYILGREEKKCLSKKLWKCRHYIGLLPITIMKTWETADWITYINCHSEETAEVLEVRYAPGFVFSGISKWEIIPSSFPTISALLCPGQFAISKEKIKTSSGCSLHLSFCLSFCLSLYLFLSVSVSLFASISLLHIQIQHMQALPLPLSCLLWPSHFVLPVLQIFWLSLELLGQFCIISLISWSLVPSAKSTLPWR